MPRSRLARASRGATAFALLALLAACTRETPPQRQSVRAFGGQATIDVRAVPPERGAAALADVVARFETLNREWHAWEPGPLTELNAALARGERHRPPASLRDLILRSQPLSIRSDGVFDPAIGGLMRLWGFHSGDRPITSPVPGLDAIDAWRAGRPSIADVAVDGEDVYSVNPAVQLDFGGIAEGVAAEEATRILARHGIANALISLGGDVYALGDAGGRPWQVAIDDPYGGVLADVALHDREALFSSGNYNKFRPTPSGGRWSHVLDPRTGQPVQGSAAVAVLHRDPVLADIAATTLMVAGPARFADLTMRLGIRCAVLVTEENEMLLTAAMQQRIVLHREPVRLGQPLGEAGPCSP